MIDVAALTVPAAKFTSNEVQKGSPDKSKMEKRFTKLVEAVDDKSIKLEDDIPTKNARGLIPQPANGHIRRLENQPGDVHYSDVFG